MLRKKRMPAGDVIVFNFVAYPLLAIFALFCLAPFLLIVMGSISSEKSIMAYGYSLFPREFSLQAYRTAFAVPTAIGKAYAVTVLVTSVGTAVGLFLSTMTAYVMQRKDFRYRNILAFFLYFTTLFSGGLVPWYILMVKYLGMRDNLIALILPGLFNVFHMIILRTFIGTIPESLSESAKIDGAKDLRIFIQIILPLSKPVLASIGMFIALAYWNDWFNAMLFIKKEALMPLQYFLYRILSQIQVLRYMLDSVPQAADMQLPDESFKMAMTIVSIGPILALYPFLQRFFVRGITIGAVKG